MIIKSGGGKKLRKRRIRDNFFLLFKKSHIFRLFIFFALSTSRRMSRDEINFYILSFSCLVFIKTSAKYGRYLFSREYWKNRHARSQTRATLATLFKSGKFIETEEQTESVADFNLLNLNWTLSASLHSFHIISSFKPQQTSLMNCTTQATTTKTNHIGNLLFVYSSKNTPQPTLSKYTENSREWEREGEMSWSIRES